jgi:hypothetical protein
VRRYQSARQDQLRLQQRNLSMQEWLTGGRFLDMGVAVTGWSALDNVGDKDLLTGEADRRQHRVQQLSGTTDEGLPLSVLVGARRLADHHQTCIPVPCAKNGLGSGLVQIAAAAVDDGLTQTVPSEAGNGIEGGQLRIRDRGGA